MTIEEATKLAKDALENVTVLEPEDVADLTVLYKNGDHTWSVCDNGEEAICYTEAEVIRVIIENLTGSGTELILEK